MKTKVFFVCFLICCAAFVPLNATGAACDKSGFIKLCTIKDLGESFIMVAGHSSALTPNTKWVESTDIYGNPCCRLVCENTSHDFYKRLTRNKYGEETITDRACRPKDNSCNSNECYVGDNTCMNKDASCGVADGLCTKCEPQRRTCLSNQYIDDNGECAWIEINTCGGKYPDANDKMVQCSQYSYPKLNAATNMWDCSGKCNGEDGSIFGMPCVNRQHCKHKDRCVPINEAHNVLSKDDNSCGSCPNGASIKHVFMNGNVNTQPACWKDGGSVQDNRVANIDNLTPNAAAYLDWYIKNVLDTAPSATQNDGNYDIPNAPKTPETTTPANPTNQSNPKTPDTPAQPAPVTCLPGYVMAPIPLSRQMVCTPTSTAQIACPNKPSELCGIATHQMLAACAACFDIDKFKSCISDFGNRFCTE
ncbi:MAG: hypothetical protein LBJ73_04880 [Rickettsiales bacterium]|jgi:hypothetical protein|nr:hypothetical protein [Rickettsiales bacterium]